MEITFKFNPNDKESQKMVSDILRLEGRKEPRRSYHPLDLFREAVASALMVFASLIQRAVYRVVKPRRPKRPRGQITFRKK